VTVGVIRVRCGRAPSREEWDDAIGAGWHGSDGSSLSTDRICGVVIGVTTVAWSDLPAPIHDFWYYVLRSVQYRNLISPWEASYLRRLADDHHRRLLLALAGQARFGMGWLYRARCYARWSGLRLFGGGSIVPKPDREGYAAP